MNYGLNKFYSAIGTTKQQFFKRRRRMLADVKQIEELIPVVDRIRRDHPGMNLRDIWRIIKSCGIGRDRFEMVFKELGYGVVRSKAFDRTTDSTGVKRFPNLMEGIELNGVNQVWVSDITYFSLGSEHYYLTFILDLYSRRIVGYSVSRSLKTEDTTLPALVMAIRLRRGPKGLEGLVFHSDGGGQYYSNRFLGLITQFGIISSMGKCAYENPHAERLNGIIKNNYVMRYNPLSYGQLVQMTEKAVKMYNLAKPHRALGGQTPIGFEELLSTKCIVIDKRKKEPKKEKLTS